MMVMFVAPAPAAKTSERERSAELGRPILGSQNLSGPAGGPRTAGRGAARGTAQGPGSPASRTRAGAGLRRARRGSAGRAGCTLLPAAGAPARPGRVVPAPAAGSARGPPRETTRGVSIPEGRV